MSGRPRLYVNAAEKTRAYREREEQRTVKIDRITLEQIEEHLERLRQAVNAAQDRGDPLAQSLRTMMITDILADLASYFESGTMLVRPAVPHGRKR
ncbi:MAG: hypothetical protein NVS9B15_23560 [Acidobacteriaceae bacterium]